MSIGSRIKERRENLNMTRVELAEKISVTPSAIANYENAVSSPKIELMYRLFEELNCDANYLYQDDMEIMTKFNCTLQEQDHIKKYRNLDDHGKEMVDFTLKKEYERSTAPVDNIVEISIAEHLNAVAAHNDSLDGKCEQEKVKRDIENLKRPK